MLMLRLAVAPSHQCLPLMHPLLAAAQLPAIAFLRAAAASGCPECHGPSHRRIWTPQCHATCCQLWRPIDATTLQSSSPRRLRRLILTVLTLGWIRRSFLPLLIHFLTCRLPTASVLMASRNRALWAIQCHTPAHSLRSGHQLTHAIATQHLGFTPIRRRHISCGTSCSSRRHMAAILRTTVMGSPRRIRGNRPLCLAPLRLTFLLKSPPASALARGDGVVRGSGWRLNSAIMRKTWMMGGQTAAAAVRRVPARGDGRMMPWPQAAASATAL